MTPQQKTEVKILDARPKLNALLDVAIEERSDDQKSEIVSLSETLQTLDTDLKAAILAAPDKPETLDCGETRGPRKARASRQGEAVRVRRGRARGQASEMVQRPSARGVRMLRQSSSRNVRE